MEIFIKPVYEVFVCVWLRKNNRRVTWTLPTKVLSVQYIINCKDSVLQRALELFILLETVPCLNSRSPFPLPQPWQPSFYFLLRTLTTLDPLLGVIMQYLSFFECLISHNVYKTYPCRVYGRISFFMVKKTCKII